MSSNPTYREFERLCAQQPTTELTLAHVRKIVLYQTRGLCAVDKLINTDDGSMRNIRAVCAATAPDIPTSIRFWKRWQKDMDANVAKLMAQETREMKRSVLLSKEAATLSTMTSAYRSEKHGALSSFRVAVVESFKTRAIHFFRWDGTCRSSAEEICRALHRYPSTKRGMALKWKVVLGLGVAATVLTVAGSYAAHRIRAATSKDAQPSSPLPDDETPARRRQALEEFLALADQLRLHGHYSGIKPVQSASSLWDTHYSLYSLGELKAAYQKWIGGGCIADFAPEMHRYQFVLKDDHARITTIYKDHVKLHNMPVGTEYQLHGEDGHGERVSSLYGGLRSRHVFQSNLRNLAPEYQHITYSSDSASHTRPDFDYGPLLAVMKRDMEHDLKIIRGLQELLTERLPEYNFRLLDDKGHVSDKPTTPRRHLTWKKSSSS